MARTQEGTRLAPGTLHVPTECRRISSILSRVGDKWTILVVGQLGDGTKRFNELRRALGSISQRMLTLTLRGLERDGFVVRTQHPTIPPRVDYALTELGHDLLKPVSALGDWARRHAGEIDSARAAFDADETRRRPLATSRPATSGRSAL